jgi:predicted CXXCH cytochrome family protein
MPRFRFAFRLLPCLLAALLLPSHSWTGDPAVGPPVEKAGTGSLTEPLVTGSFILDLTHAGPPPLAMPTAVAVAGSGKAYVVDGVNDRIVVFNASGEFAGEFGTVAGMQLSRPMSVKIDTRNRLWISDTGNGRVVWKGLANDLEKVVRAGQEAGSRGLDITDVAVTPDALTAWLVANDDQVLLRADLERGHTRRIGQEGEGPGQFRYPFMIALAADGDAYVTDVVNGRVVVFKADGSPAWTLGTYGLRAGNLYRPGGIALDKDGRIWVSDSVLGSVQIFSPKGEFLGVLHEAEGEPMRFDMPMGLAFGPGGDLFVVELNANRVRRVQVQVHPGAPPAVPQTPPDIPAALQPRTCTACHLDWMFPLVNGEGTEFVQPGEDLPDDPRVSHGRTCLSCHDGIVADSRREVWASRGHPIGSPREPGGPVPTTLPMPAGKILCRTCHSAHLRTSPTTVATAVTLRAKRDPSELCEDCHRGFQAGTAEGMHPLAEMKVPLPEALVPPGDWTEGKNVTCLICHRAHGARGDDLLALDDTTNELCARCHEALSPDLFADGKDNRHGGRPVLTPDQRAVAEGYKTRLGPDGELLCTTCHLPHNAPVQHFLLAFDPASPTACSECHPAQKSVIRSSHDLRGDHPTAKNVLGVTAREGGPCSGCHTGHRYGRDPSPTSLDPKGLCLACHRKGRVAAATRLGPVNHPKTPCEKCHNPHEVRWRKYLQGPPSDLCQGCHEPMRQMHGGPHDLKRNPKKWPAAAAETRDLCLACHRVHGTDQTGLFRLGLSAYAPIADATCVACHASSAPGTEGDLSLLHPGPVKAFSAPEALTLKTTATGKLMIACTTCHDPHRAKAAGSAAGALLRGETEEGGTGWGLCLACHPQMTHIASTGHVPVRFAKAGFETAGCQPCHLIHTRPGTVEASLLFPDSLLKKATSSPLNLAADRYCVACHRPGGPVAPPRIATHPSKPMSNPTPPDQPGFLPLFNAKGQVDRNGSIGCRTCHVTHGRAEPGNLPHSSDPLSASGERARVWRLRNFTEGNVCSLCHGLDALWRFLYFHDPGVRGPTPEKAFFQPARPPVTPR